MTKVDEIFVLNLFASLPVRIDYIKMPCFCDIFFVLQKHQSLFYIQFYLIITLSLGSIEINCVINETML